MAFRGWDCSHPGPGPEEINIGRGVYLSQPSGRQRYFYFATRNQRAIAALQNSGSVTDFGQGAPDLDFSATGKCAFAQTNRSVDQGKRADAATTPASTASQDENGEIYLQFCVAFHEDYRSR